MVKNATEWSAYSSEPEWTNIGPDCLPERHTAVNRFDASDIASKVAPEINDFNPEEHGSM